MRYAYQAYGSVWFVGRIRLGALCCLMCCAYQAYGNVSL